MLGSEFYLRGILEHADERIAFAELQEKKDHVEVAVNFLFNVLEARLGLFATNQRTQRQ